MILEMFNSDNFLGNFTYTWKATLIVQQDIMFS